jgi:hypothetical protein
VRHHIQRPPELTTPPIWTPPPRAAKLMRHTTQTLFSQTPCTGRQALSSSGRPRVATSHCAQSCVASSVGWQQDLQSLSTLSLCHSSFSRCRVLFEARAVLCVAGNNLHCIEVQCDHFDTNGTNMPLSIHECTYSINTYLV